MTPSVADDAAPAGSRPTITLAARTVRGEQGGTAAIRGRVHPARVGTSVRVSYREAGRWRRFPIPATIDSAGRFTAYVDMGRPGVYALRVTHVPSGATSAVVKLTVK